MTGIQWNEKSYSIDGNPGFLVSGEFHYFRVPRKDWKARLELFREAGGNCVATYIPWILHEPVEGQILFGDAPWRDLEGFLTLCRELGMNVICRPGPYQYSEMKYDGLPGWLCENYPEMLARDVHGAIFRKESVSYLHPVFLEKVKTWFDTVCPIIAKYTVARGGTVVFAQFDNEMAGVHEWFGGWDYNPDTLGLGCEEGRYAAFLKRRYGSIEPLNVCYETQFNSFAEVKPFDGAEFRGVAERRRARDYQDFYFSMLAEYASILTGWMKEAGIDCDILHNSGNPGMNSYFLETAAKLGKGFLLGSDHYYNLDMDWEGNSPTPKYAVKVLYSNEMLRLMGFPATVLELPGGSCSNWPPITLEDLKCCYMTNVALGMKGFNYYIFTGGPNPEHIGSSGNDYDYGAAIGSDGSVRPGYYIQKEFHSFLGNHSWLADAGRAGDYYLGLDWEHSRSKQYSAGFGEFGNSDAWSFLQKGLMITSLCASYAPEFVDLNDDCLVQKTDKPLVIAASECMAASTQERLVKFVKNGGRLLLAPVIPHLDENFNACTILKEFLDDASAERAETPMEVNVGPIKNVYVNMELFVSGKQPEGAEQIAVEAISGKTAAWMKDYPGGGMVLWLGLHWKHSRNEHTDMLKYLLLTLKCGSPTVLCSNPNLWTTLLVNGDKRMLFIMNLFSSPMECDIKVKKSAESYVDTGHHVLKPMEVKTVIV